MKVLIVGGNRFLGIELTARLLSRGHQVTILNRGNLADPFGGRVTRLVADRGTDAFDRVLKTSTFDVVVDCALFDGVQAERLIRVLNGRAGHVIVISTGQVYLVRSPRPVIAVERDYQGSIQAAPALPSDEPDWRYGIEKRQVEDTLFRSDLPFTTLRLPMVHGGRDHKRRIDSVLWRLMDGGPLFMTQPEAPVRHVFSGAVVAAIELLVVAGPQRQAFNLAWSESLTARQFVERIGESFGVRPKLVVADPAELGKAGIDATLACIGNSRWMSALDAGAAQVQLGFSHPPIAQWLPQVIHASVSRWSEAPASMVQRGAELRWG